MGSLFDILNKKKQQQSILNIFIWCLESHEGLLEPPRVNTHGLDKPIRQEWMMSCGNDETSTYLSSLPNTMDELMDKICRPCYKWHRSSMNEVLLRWVPMIPLVNLRTEVGFQTQWMYLWIKICRPRYKWHRSSMNENVVVMSSDDTSCRFMDFPRWWQPQKNHPGACIHTYYGHPKILVSRLMHVRGRPHNTMMRFAWGFVPGLCYETPPKGIGQL